MDPRGQAIPAIIAGICARNPQACRALITATALTIYNYLYPSKKGGCPVFNSESAPPNDNTAPPPSSGPPTTENPPARPPIDINDPETLKDRTPNEVRDALNGNPNLTGPTPTRDGNGERWTVNGRPGEQVIINNGYPEGLAGGGGDGVKTG